MNREIREYCGRRGFSSRTEARWLGLDADDSSSLLSLMEQVKAGENHLKDILDWLEEISLRDGTAIAQLLQSLAAVVDDPRLGRNDKLKRFKDELRRLRFPRLARIEDDIERRIRELKLSPEISLGVPVGLEGGGVVLKLQAASYEDMQRLAAEAARAAESEKMKEIFEAMNGAAAE